MSSLSNKIKILRKNNHLTQKELAEKLFIDDSSISKYENDKAIPENQLLQKIADFFHVSIDYLLGRTDDPMIKAYTNTHDKVIIDIEVYKNYPYGLTPTQVKKLIDSLDEVGFDVDKLIEKVKSTVD